MPLLDQLRHGVDVTKFKADQALRINRVQNEIGGLRRDILGIREKIADAVLQLHKQNALSYSELEEMCASIDQIDLRIAEKEAQINSIRAEVPPQTARPSMPTYQPSAPTAPGTPRNPCPNCMFDAPIGAAFCPNCGKSIPQQPPDQSIDGTLAGELNKCVACGALLPESATFCPECGQPIAPPTVAQQS